MKIIKYLFLLMTLILLVGCGPEEKPPSNNYIDNEDDPVTNIGRLEIRDGIKSNVDLSPYDITRIYSVIKKVLIPNEKDDDILNVNISNEILLDVNYYNERGESPKKIEISNIKILERPIKGNLKLYAIKSGGNNNYLEEMYDNEITESSVIYEKDFLGNKLKDGRISIMFSAYIENVVTIDEKDFRLNLYRIVDIADIPNTELEFKIEFDIDIYTENRKYSLPFYYSFDARRIYKNEYEKSYNFVKPVGFYYSKKLK